MKRRALLTGLTVLFSQQVGAYQRPPEDGRAAFRKAVEDYQIFVVPHCAPDEVRAYVTAREDRDRTFMRSLRKTDLEADYRQAVTERANKDRQTVYECFGPPPPPLPPGAEPSTGSSAEPPHRDTTAEHFAAGDRQFAVMVRMRDELIGHPHL